MRLKTIKGNDMNKSGKRLKATNTRNTYIHYILTQ